jgi:hypothetical protein
MVQTVDESKSEDRGNIRIIASSDKVDDALRFLKVEHSDRVVSDINEKSFVRKIDRFIMPLLFGVYYLQFTDKTLRENHSNISEFWIISLPC